MGLSVKVGELAVDTTSAGNQGFTGFGFQPKVFLGFNAWTTQNATTQGVQNGWGAAITGPLQMAASLNANDSQGNPTTRRRASSTSIAINVDLNGNLINDMAVASLDADGVTIDVNTTNASTTYLKYLALGGTDITNVAYGTVTINAASASVAETGVGFQPDLVILLHTYDNGIGGSGAGAMGLGFATASTQAAWAVNHNTGTSVAQNDTIQRSDNCVAAVSQGGDAIEALASLASMDSDGFTLTVNDAPGFDGFVIQYIAIKGGQWKVGVETSPTTATTKATTGVGFQPAALAFVGHLVLSSTAAQAGYFGCFGASDGTNHQMVSFDADDAANTSNTGRSGNTGKCLGIVNSNGTANITVAHVNSLDADGFTLNWTTAPGALREFIYLAAGASPVVASAFTPRVMVI